MLPPHVIAFCDKLCGQVSLIGNQICKGALSLVHGDTWINNFLFKSSKVDTGNDAKSDDNGDDFDANQEEFQQPIGPDSVCVLDWQTICIGTPLLDVATLLDAAHNIAINPMHVLKLYHTTLLDYGVPHYTMAQCIEDFKVAKKMSFIITFTIFNTFLMAKDFLKTKEELAVLNYALQNLEWLASLQ